MRFISRAILFLLAGSAIAFADGITPAALAKDGAVTRDRHLSEISDIMFFSLNYRLLVSLKPCNVYLFFNHS